MGLILYILYQKLFTDNAVLGWASTMSVGALPYRADRDWLLRDGYFAAQYCSPPEPIVQKAYISTDEPHS